MARQLNTSAFPLRRAVTPLLLCFGLSFSALGLSQAAQPGHGRVSSIPGAPLQVSVPITGLTSDDLKVLNASVADVNAWAQAGLSLPASIESLSVTVEPGFGPGSRTLVLRSTQVVDRPVIDVLIRLTTASGTTSVQSSYLVLANESSAASRSVRVVRGDTLYAIALSKAVTGADLYQVMWAIYEANPQAFIADNMHLLRAGATLNIPDAAIIRAVDAKYARSMFAKHDQAFRVRRGLGQTDATVPTVTNASTQSGSVTSPLPVPGAAASGDQVRLASTNPADQQADARVASANELREMQSRVEALQKNVEDLKEALHKSQAAAGSVGATGAAGSSGVDGQKGAPGSVGHAGATGASGATGAAGATGATGATGAAGAGASVGIAGTSDASPAANAANASSASGLSGAQAVAGTSTKDTTQGTGPQAASEIKTGVAKFTQYASDHVLGFVLGISALLALLIAFLLKRAGRNARLDEIDQVPSSHPGLASAFDQKLQSIDLNLSDDDKPAPASGSNKTGV